MPPGISTLKMGVGELLPKTRDEIQTSIRERYQNSTYSSNGLNHIPYYCSKSLELPSITSLDQSLIGSLLSWPLEHIRRGQKARVVQGKPPYDC